MITRSDYYDNETWKNFLNTSNNFPTPHVIINLDIVRNRYKELANNFPYAKIYYAVKANPSIEILEILKQLDANFDIASIYELDRVLALNISPNKLSFGNTIKKASDIKYAYQKGIRLFATDSKSDLDNIAKHAPNSKIYVRTLLQNTTTADWPLSKKFGCHPDKVISLLKNAQELGLEPYGISFHVGSQQRDVGEWNEAIVKTKYLFDALLKEGIKLKMINMGGGFPAKYIQKTSNLSVYAINVANYLTDAFGAENIPEIILEPGRGLVGDAGVLVTEIIMTARKSYTDEHRWVYIDAGKFNGLVETLDEAIKYPVVTSKPDNSDNGAVILAGPTCDSVDVLYEKYQYELPLNLSEGDRLYWLTAGAYTTSYASVEFNGFPPIKAYFFDGAK